MSAKSAPRDIWAHVSDIERRLKLLERLSAKGVGQSVTVPQHSVTSHTTAVEIKDEGVLQGAALTFDFVGSGVTATLASGVATITVSGGGGGGLVLGSGTPSNVASAGGPGSSTDASAFDHVHGHGSGYLPNAHHNQAHVLASADHTASGLTAGQVLRAATATTFAWATLAHSDLGSVGANDHHNQAHVLASADHTASGLTAGQVLRAASATTFAWTQLAHSDLGSIGANDHHNQAHVLDGADHTVSGLTAGNVLRAATATTFAWAQLAHSDLGSVGADDHHAQAHGAADHTDITRTIYLDASNGAQTDGGTAGNIGTAPDINRLINLADAATQGVVFPHFLMPADAKAASPITIKPVWTPGSTDATPHTVRWSVDAYVMASPIDAAGTTTAFTGASAAHTAKDYVIDTETQILASVSAGDLIRLDVRRIGADAADTYVGVVGLIGVIISYTAIQ